MQDRARRTREVRNRNHRQRVLYTSPARIMGHLTLHRPTAFRAVLAIAASIFALFYISGVE